MRITSKGQVTIPQEIRQRLGLLPETEVEFDVVGNTVRIRKVARAPGARAGHRRPAARPGDHPADDRRDPGAHPGLAAVPGSSSTATSSSTC